MKLRAYVLMLFVVAVDAKRFWPEIGPAAPAEIPELLARGMHDVALSWGIRR